MDENSVRGAIFMMLQQVGLDPLDKMFLLALIFRAADLVDQNDKFPSIVDQVQQAFYFRRAQSMDFGMERLILLSPLVVRTRSQSYRTGQRTVSNESACSCSKSR